ncbi:MAG: TetR/AcrR family transcriptional regulator, partial [Clostridiales bacterium]|nr:TetR/AcrR family transcriptional regulator [Clostridiales bacterium]
MQYQKEEMKNAILISAEQEFFSMGFSGASLRSIAKNAQTTLGNIYNYFENKEAILDEIVNHEYMMFESIIKEHEQDQNSGRQWDNVQPEQWEEEIDMLGEMLLGLFSKRFYLLFTCGESAKYITVRSKTKQLITDHLLHDFAKQKHQIVHQNAIVEMISMQFIESML